MTRNSRYPWNIGLLVGLLLICGMTLQGAEEADDQSISVFVPGLLIADAESEDSDLDETSGEASAPSVRPTTQAPVHFAPATLSNRKVYEERALALDGRGGV